MTSLGPLPVEYQAANALSLAIERAELDGERVVVEAGEVAGNSVRFTVNGVAFVAVVMNARASI